MNNKINKIFIINFGGIGDEILFLPTIISLKKTYPKCKITLCLEKRTKSIKDLTDLIDELYFVDIKGKNKYSELSKMVFKARFGGYDAIISSGGNKLISLLLFMTGIKTRIGYNTGKLSQILLTNAVELNKNQYAPKMYHTLATPLTDIVTELPEINVQPQEKIENSVLIHPGVSQMSIKKGIIKTVPAQTWAKVLKLLIEKGKHVILTGGPDDKECIEIIKKECGTFDYDDYTQGQIKSLKDLAELIGKSEKFLCSDSAPLHVAVAMKTRTYAIFGSTDENKLIPKADFVTAIKSKKHCPLAPCLWERRQTSCAELTCLDISAEEIAEIVTNS